MVATCHTFILSLIVLLIFATLPASGSDRIIGDGGVVAVVCTDVYGYKNYSALRQAGRRRRILIQVIISHR